MDSETATNTSPAGKIRRCSCGRKMSSLIHDFHSICHRCPECTDVGDAVMSKYVTHKLSLQHKLQSKRSKKDPVPAPVVADVATESAVVKLSASPVPASVPVVSPVCIDYSSQSVRGEILRQVKSLFDSFAQSLEA